MRTEQDGEQNHAVDRRCEVVLENGRPCRGTPALDETRCHAHRRFRDAAAWTVVTIPLMEDEASITFVRSQTVRALAQGSIPPANGRVMLEGCRDAERLMHRRLAVRNTAMRYAALAEKLGTDKLDRLMRRFVEQEQGAAAGIEAEESAPPADDPKAAENPRAAWDELMRSIDHEAEIYRQRFRQMKEDDARKAAMRAEWERKEALRKAGIADEQPTPAVPLPEPTDRGSAIGDPPALSPTAGDRRPTAPAAAAPADSGQGGAPAAVGIPHNSGAPEEPEPAMHQSVFPGVREEWDRALLRTGAKVTEMVAPAEGESWYTFLERKKERDAAIAAAV